MKDKLIDLRDSLRTWISNNKKSSGKVAAIVAVLVLALGMKVFGNTAPDKVDDDRAEVVVAYVDISGEVMNPGIYEVSEDTRLFELIEMAGGLKDDADLDQINQAEYIEDGQKIIIPAKAQESPTEVISSSGGSVPAANGTAKININSASKEELKQLSGIGDVIAERIIEYRSTSRFTSIEDIKNVKGIGDAIYEKIKAEITV